MAGFGLKAAVDFSQKLQHERADFVQSKCLDPRHALWRDDEPIICANGYSRSLVVGRASGTKNQMTFAKP
jgi:hypothetical protein